MNTREYVDLFYQDCRDRGLSPATIRTYDSVLKHFIDEYPELPTGAHKINDFLKARGETPKKRGPRFRSLQAFYTSLERAGHIKESPVPSKGKVGRPAKPTLAKGDKLRQGGGSLYSSSSTSISTAQAVKAFTTSRALQGVAKNTLIKYSFTLGRFSGQYPSLPTTPEPIEAFIGSIKGEPETRWTYWQVLKAFYAFLEKRHNLFDQDNPNPLKLVPPVKLLHKVRKTLDFDQLQRLFSLELSFQERAILMLLLDTGLRSGELSSLTRENVHPGFIIVTGKTGAHTIPISQEIYETLIQLADSGPLFTAPQGPLDRKSLYGLISDLMARAGITKGKRGPHMLRHSFARHYIAGGGDLMSLKAILGHERVETTQIYAELDDVDIQKRHAGASPFKKLTNGGTNNA